MATIISHTAIPIAFFWTAGRKKISPRLFVTGILLSMAPDLDIIGFYFNIDYGAALGHRGMTHSLFFAAVVALLLTRFSKFLRSRPVMIFIFSFISMASHGVLDALTNGGLGVAFFWPFSNRRFFFPWHEIIVSPIGLKNFLNNRAWVVFQSEIIYIWAPCLTLVFLFHRFQAKKRA